MSGKCRSSFNGKIYEIPALCVDNFENPSKDGARAYFLSHYHTDHTVGLNKYALLQKLETEKNVFIYATKLTAAIIVHDDQNLKEYVRVLKLGSNLITIPDVNGMIDSEIIVNVTLIPAGHCLGSIMFLFETTLFKVLYTGDFRIRPNDLSKYAAFHDVNGEIIKLDALYVDTTFQDEDKYESFPKRSDSIDEVMGLIRGYLDSHKDQLLVLKTSARFGYEYVFNKIYELFGIKVYVDDKKWAFYSNILNLVKGVTNNPNETRIFLTSVPYSRSSCLPAKIIKLSAMVWHNWDEDKSSVEENGNYVNVCFSTHCSRTELISFVEYLNPRKVIGFRDDYKVHDSPRKSSNVEKLVLSPKRSPRKLSHPDKTDQKDKKVDAAILRKIFG